MDNHVYIPRDVRFSENVLWSLDMWGTIWFILAAIISLFSFSTIWRLFGITGLGIMVFIDAMVYVYHSEYPGRNPLRMRDVIRPIITFFIHQRLNYKLIDVLSKMSEEEYMLLAPEKIKPIFVESEELLL